MKKRWLLSATFFLAAGCGPRGPITETRDIDMSVEQTRTFVRTALKNRGWETEGFQGENAGFYLRGTVSKEIGIRVKVSPSTQKAGAAHVEATGAEVPTRSLLTEIEKRLPSVAH